MRGEGERCEAARLDIDAELFFKLADQRPFRRLAVMHLAAGKFPKPGHGLALRPLSQQHAAVGVDQRDGRHEDDRLGRLSSGNCH